MKKKGVETYFNTFHLGREGFGPSKAEPTDLQSAPFDRSGTYPFIFLQTAETVCGDNLHKLAADCKPFFSKLGIFLQVAVSEGGNEERNAQNCNDDGEHLPLGDTVPHGGIGLFEAFADDAGCSIEESKEGRKKTGWSLAPHQADAE